MFFGMVLLHTMIIWVTEPWQRDRTRQWSSDTAIPSEALMFYFSNISMHNLFPAKLYSGTVSTTTQLSCWVSELEQSGLPANTVKQA